MQASENTLIERPQAQRSVLAALGLIIGAGMLLAILAGMVGGQVHGWKAGVTMLIIASVPVCTLGTCLALASLVWRNESKSLAQASLWLNGMIAFFAFPLMVYWLLAMH